MRIVIVGGSRGIGKALADHLRKKGHDVIVVARSSPRDRYLDIRLLVAPAVLEEIFRDANAVICCAALYDAPAADVVLTNVLGTWHVAKSACLTLEPGGSVILFAGGGVGGPNPGRDCPALYAATKAAVVQMAECLANDYPTVRINAIAPGMVDTGLTPHGGDTPEATVKFVEWLLDQQHISGRLLSVKWDMRGEWDAGSFGNDKGKLRRV
jgi:NAD(P)-dependent dehydrogenase (short-subunit alcohol dehydrogenase family)